MPLLILNELPALLLVKKTNTKIQNRINVSTSSCYFPFSGLILNGQKSSALNGEEEKNLMPQTSSVHVLTTQKAGLEMCSLVIYVLYTV